MPRTLITPEQIDPKKFEGLRINDGMCLSVSRGHVALLFSDATACVLVSDNTYSDQTEIKVLTDKDDLRSSAIQLALGLISKTEFDALELEAQATKKRWQVAEQERAERQDRSEYDRLRLKFEGKPN